MGDIDDKILAEAAQIYTSQRRSYWRFFLCGIAWTGFFGAPLLAFGPQLKPLVNAILGVLLAVGFLAFWCGGLVVVVRADAVPLSSLW